MLLKKSPHKNCRIGNWNKRIQAEGLLNQDCAFARDLDSMLLPDPCQNPFSTVSVNSDGLGPFERFPVRPRKPTWEQTSVDFAFVPEGDIARKIVGQNPPERGRYLMRRQCALCDCAQSVAERL